MKTMIAAAAFVMKELGEVAALLLLVAVSIAFGIGARGEMDKFHDSRSAMPSPTPMVPVNNQEEYDVFRIKYPAGTHYMAPDGKGNGKMIEYMLAAKNKL
jgi:hypothetical protein